MLGFVVLNNLRIISVILSDAEMQCCAVGFQGNIDFLQQPWSDDRMFTLRVF
jgi:hypothetical protein